MIRYLLSLLMAGAFLRVLYASLVGRPASRHWIRWHEDRVSEATRRRYLE